MEYFKPMLEDKTLTMCQDVTPNTSEGKKIMYAITWDETGTRMIQVGIEPVRLLNEVKQNEMSSVVTNMPVYEGIRIFVADKESGKIYGATDSSDIGKKLDDIGITKRVMRKVKYSLVSMRSMVKIIAVLFISQEIMRWELPAPILPMRKVMPLRC